MPLILFWQMPIVFNKRCEQAAKRVLIKVFEANLVAQYKKALHS